MVQCVSNVGIGDASVAEVLVPATTDQLASVRRLLAEMDDAE